MDWPFDAEPGTACISSAAVTERGEPICVAFHDRDGWWQFHAIDGAPDEMSEGRMIALEQALALEPTLAEVAKLAPGWVAFRKGPGQPWGKRQQGT